MSKIRLMSGVTAMRELIEAKDKRIAELEARVVELEKELNEERILSGREIEMGS